MKNVIIFLALLLIIPALAFAHAGMKKSSPPKNAVMTSSPEKIVIEFESAVEPAFSKIEVFDQEKNKVSKKTLFLKDNTILETGLIVNLPPGMYKVKWKIMSLDGHKLSGKYTFTIE